MSRLWYLVLHLFAAFVGGGLLAPWVWWGMQSAAAAAGSGDGWLVQLAAQPFLRYVHRCVLVLALVGLWPLARGLGVGGAGDLGLLAPRAWKRLGLGFLAGGLMFALTLSVELGFGWRIAKPDPGLLRILAMLGAAAVSALAVGVLEEVLFRGVLCRGLAGRLGWGPAILVSSLVYAWTHFLSKGPRPESVGPWTGLHVVADMVVGSLHRDPLLPGMPTLVLAGVLLGLLLRDTGGLHASMGLHAGWVFWIKIRGGFTQRVAELGVGWGESRVSAGWPGLVAVLIALAVYLAWQRRGTGGAGRSGGAGGAGVTAASQG